MKNILMLLAIFILFQLSFCYAADKNDFVCRTTHLYTLDKSGKLVEQTNKTEDIYNFLQEPIFVNKNNGNIRTKRDHFPAYNDGTTILNQTSMKDNVFVVFSYMIHHDQVNQLSVYFKIDTFNRLSQNPFLAVFDNSVIATGLCK